MHIHIRSLFVLKHYWEIFAPFKKVFLTFFALAVVYEGLQILDGYQLTMIAGWVQEGRDIRWWIGLAIAWFVYDELFMRLDNRFDWQIIAKQTFPIYRFLKTQAVTRLLSMDIPWHRKNNSGVLIGKVVNGVQKTLELHDAASWEVVPTLIQMAWSMVPLAIWSPPTVLVSIISFAIFIFLTYRSSLAKQEFRKLRHDLSEQESHKSIESLQAVDTIIMFSQRERMLRLQDELHGMIESTALKELHIGIYKYNRWRIRVLSWSRRIVMFYWIWQLSQNPDLVKGLAALFFISVLYEKLSNSFWRFARLFDRASDASEASRRLNEVYRLKNDREATGENPTINGPVDIIFDDVCFSYDEQCTDDTAVLKNFSLTIPAGKVYAFVGPSGAGKTTVKMLAAGVYLPQYGTVKVAGIDTRDWNPDSLISLFSPVPQGDDVFIFEGTIKENIAFGKPDATIEEIIAAAKLANVHEFINSLPDTYETKVGERGKQRLSGGQKQRVAVARAILHNGFILLFDEATSAVDAITEKEMQNQMKKIMAGKSAIIIAHRLSTIWEIADQIVVIDEGKIVEQGTHSELMANGGLYARMVLLQTA